MAVAKKTRIIVLLGKDPEVRHPVVAGALDEDTFNAIDETTWNEMTERWKRIFDPDLSYLAWRLEWLTVSADRLVQVFEPKPIPAEVEA